MKTPMTASLKGQSKDTEDFVKRMQMWIYALSDARCPYGFPPRNASLVFFWQAIAAVSFLYLMTLWRRILMDRYFNHSGCVSRQYHLFS